MEDSASKISLDHDEVIKAILETDLEYTEEVLRKQNNM